MNKILYADVETTGLNPSRHGIIQIAVIAEVDGEEVDSMALDVRPLPDDVIETAALRVNGKTHEEIKGYPPAESVKSMLEEFLGHRVDRYNSSDKFALVAYNASFDDDFLRAWFKKLGDSFYGSWIWWPPVDAAVLAMMRLGDRRAEMPNFKLATVAKELGIEVDEEQTHDALYDVRLAREVFVRSRVQDTKPARIDEGKVEAATAAEGG